MTFLYIFSSKYGDKDISEKQSDVLHVLWPYQKSLNRLILKIWAIKCKDVHMLVLIPAVIFYCEDD
jgi:hypothetical protein